MSGVLQLLMGDNAPASGTAVTWDPVNLGTNITLSNSNKTATKLSAQANWTNVIATLARSTGLYYFEIHTGATVDAMYMGLLNNANYAINTTFTSQTDAWSCGGYAHLGRGIFTDNIGLAGTLSSATIGFAINLTTGKCFAALANSYTGNPVLGTGQNATFTSGPSLLPACGLFGDGTGNIVCTLAAKAADQTFSPPTGYSTWE